MTTEQRLAICKEALREIVRSGPRCDECSSTHRVIHIAEDALEKVSAQRRAAAPAIPPEPAQE